MRLAILLFVLLVSPVFGQQVTPSTVVASLKNPVLEKIQLVGEFPLLQIKLAYAKPLVIDASKATVKGLVITGSNVRWYGGVIKAPKGFDGLARDGYCVSLTNCKDVVLSNVTFTEAKIAVVPGNTENTTIQYCVFTGLRQDGISATKGRKLSIVGNTFKEFSPIPTTCTIPSRKPDGTVDKDAPPTIERGLSSAICKALGGTWIDGDHSDAIQIRDGIDGLLISGNTLEGMTQGIGEMAGTNDARLNDVQILNNTIKIDGNHSITINDLSTNIVAIGNRVIQWNGKKSPLRLPANAISLDNQVQ